MSDGVATSPPLTREDLEQRLVRIWGAPVWSGILELIVCRPGVAARGVLEIGTLDVDEGLVGDNWRQRADKRRADHSPDPDCQIAIMSVRAAALLCGVRERWQLAGDQLFIDIDLSYDGLPVGSALALGNAIIEMTPQRHLSCGKFASRFGVEARRLATSPQGLALNLRGRYARVLRGGRIRTGDTAKLLGSRFDLHLQNRLLESAGLDGE